MSIINGQVANADEVLNALGSNFNDTMQGIFNQDYIGWDSRLVNEGEPNLKKVFYSTFQTTDNIDRANTTMYYDEILDLWFVADTIDDTNDGTVDTN